MNTETKRQILKIRIRDLALKGNFQKCYSDIKCPITGCNENETQYHVFQSFCVFKSNIQELSNSVLYEDIFGNDVRSQVIVASTIFENLKRRNKLLPSPDVRSEGPEEPRRKGEGNRVTASPSLVIREARAKRRYKGKQK